MGYEEPPNLTPEEDALLDAVWDRMPAGYVTGYNGRMAGKPFNEGETEGWRQGWNQADQVMKNTNSNGQKKQ